LLAYETEVFCECGAWSNLTEMEESLLLIELMELYDNTIERQSRMINALGQMFGGVSGMHSAGAYGSENNNVVVYGEEDINQLPFGLGYEVADSEH
jgi:hypothetical protein